MGAAGAYSSSLPLIQLIAVSKCLGYGANDGKAVMFQRIFRDFSRALLVASTFPSDRKMRLVSADRTNPAGPRAA